MPKPLQYALIVLFALALALSAAFGAAVWLGERKMARTLDVRVVPVAFVSDAAALKAGKYLFESRGCADCHGLDGGGRVKVDEEDGVYARTPNLTSGRGTAVAGYTEADWVRAIRHGVGREGRALLAMPSEDYSRLTDADLAAIVAYTRALAPVAGEPAEMRMPAMMKALYAIGLIDLAADRIDHRLPPPPPVAPGETAEHGAYLANMCVGCHGANLSGGRIPGAPPQWPPAANLTPVAGGAMARYDTVEKFAAMLRSGRRPDGGAVSPVMPFASLARLDDTDVAALHAYLRTLAPRNENAR